MHCPDWGNGRTYVFDAEMLVSGGSIRREFHRCLFRFTTYEQPEWAAHRITKRDGSIESFAHERFHGGIAWTTEKCPVTDVDGIEPELNDLDAKAIFCSPIGDPALKTLQNRDEATDLGFSWYIRTSLNQQRSSANPTLSWMSLASLRNRIH